MLQAPYNLMLNWLNKEGPSDQKPLCDFQKIRYEIKPCDVLLVEGRSRLTSVIKTVTQSPWSHAALYIGRLHDIEDPRARKKIKQFYDGQPDTQLLIESQLGLGTVIRPLNTYDRDHIRICRPRDLAYKDAQELTRFAVSRLGCDYDVRQVVDLLRFLVPWFIVPSRWRSSLFHYIPGTSARTVCSTMIAEAFSYIQYPILPLVKRQGSSCFKVFRRNPKLCVPSDFDYSPYFDIIKYPIMDLNKEANYRLLPWHGEMSLNEEEKGIYLDASVLSWPDLKLDDIAISFQGSNSDTTRTTIAAGSQQDAQLSDQPINTKLKKKKWFKW